MMKSMVDSTDPEPDETPAPQPGRSGAAPLPPAGAAGPRHRTGHRLRITLAAVVIGAVAIAAALVLTGAVTFGQDQGEATLPRLVKPTTVLATAAPGDCLTWSGDDAEVRAVDCAQPHRFEVAGPVASPLAADAPFPSGGELATIRDQQCGPVAAQYLGRRLDPMSRFQVGLLAPQRAAWRDGDRSMVCGIQTVDGAGAVRQTSGKFKSQDRSASWPVGTCLGITENGQASGPVDCVAPHAFEVTAVLDLAKHFPNDSWPTLEQQERLLAATCPDRTAKWFGSPDGLRNSGLQLQWNKISLPSWTAGARKALCFVASSKDGRSFTPITGSAKSADLLIDGNKPQLPTLPGAAPATPGR